MKYAIAVLMLAASTYACGQVDRAQEVKPAPKQEPLKCGPYQHEQKTAAHCSNTCDQDGVNCTTECRYVPAQDQCVDEVHFVTEREWQDLMKRLKALEHGK